MIQLQNLCKTFDIPGGKHTVFKDLTLDLPPGRSLGLLGRNGAGKSTLMQIIAGTMQPTAGHVIRRGKISWPIGGANSFHPDMTGLQNTRFLARCYGVDTDSLAAFVEEFAQIGTHFNMPWRTYSAGMKSRLSFGVAMGIPFDTYLIDEVTGAGDKSFRERSQTVFKARMAQADAIMISHNMSDMRNFCNSGLVLHNGVLEFFDDIETAIARHEELMRLG
ncbi:MAG: ABC-type capsular polysaccharide export system ATPase component KpsT [Roseibaca calidilacus]|uniref:ABC-type capsular polysaccharide export system ATPase component KpsT n=1 Tax=Roseibaca calidilacus TaxID=1666912 RepID=A0A0N8K769_9RHOB|nr:ABC transporter ATP-binding protein [Roseibaca calidilacus]KPP90905.1 MAG: ABC-type capsular polysaccharide export system ATPase component KpsT [Roseibaca calidilacus]CUX83773.1 capsular polysaccharide transport system ATP-binding protein [Roseibaca calidilacus]